MAAISMLSQAYGKREGSAHVILLVKEGGRGDAATSRKMRKNAKGS